LLSVQAWTLDKEAFAECQPCGTRHSISKNPKSTLCRVPVSGHSAKTPLLSVGSAALGKAYFRFLKKNCRVPDRGHSVKKWKLTDRRLLLLLSHSLTLTLSRQRRRTAAAPTPPRAAATPLRRAAPYTAPLHRRPRPTTTRRFTYSDLRLVAKTTFSDLRLVAKNF
jgi:hypothetical protein